MAQTATVVIYTRKDCSYSDAALSEMKDNGTPFKEIDIDEVPGATEELLRLSNGEAITPVMVVDGEVVIGYHGLG